MASRISETKRNYYYSEKCHFSGDHFVAFLPGLFNVVYIILCGAVKWLQPSSNHTQIYIHIRFPHAGDWINRQILFGIKYLQRLKLWTTLVCGIFYPLALSISSYGRRCLWISPHNKKNLFSIHSVSRIFPAMCSTQTNAVKRVLGTWAYAWRCSTKVVLYSCEKQAYNCQQCWWLVLSCFPHIHVYNLQLRRIASIARLDFSLVYSLFKNDSKNISTW